METAKLKIFRYHPGMDAPVYKDYDVVFEKDLSVLKALFMIADTYEDPPAFRRFYCNRGQCASCVMTINGKMRRACATQLQKETTLEPAYGYPVIRDLVVDFGRKVFSPPDRYTKVMEGSFVFKPPRRKITRERSISLSFREDICQRCESKECVEACWLSKMENLEDRFGRRLGRNTSVAEWMCAQCAEAFCAESCPTGAIAVREGNILGINALLCIGCGICMDHCPHGAIWMNIERGYAVKCDLCGGDPKCVQVCPHHALQIIRVSSNP
jgi:succinate dehydrogenase/fumarate reductase-like Fe-S protein